MPRFCTSILLGKATPLPSRTRNAFPSNVPATSQVIEVNVAFGIRSATFIAMATPKPPSKICSGEGLARCRWTARSATRIGADSNKKVDR